MNQKREISLPVGYKIARPKQETGDCCDVILVLQKTAFSDIFLFSYKQVHTFVAFVGEMS